MVRSKVRQVRLAWPVRRPKVLRRMRRRPRKIRRLMRRRSV